MIKFTKGNIFDSPADALVNTVNTQGVMGKGIALQFRKNFPNNYAYYKQLCKKKEFKIGDLIFFREANLVSEPKWIINFPTKTTWRKPSEYSYIEEGMKTFTGMIADYPDIRSVAFPPLGSGNGGLDWQQVKEIMARHLETIDIEVTIYEPNDQIIEKMKSERVKLTPARAMLLYMLYDLVGNGEFVSEFSCEKICYFLQRFGGEEYFKLQYHQGHFGPYSGKVRRVLYYLNGSYIMGYSGMDKKPFESLNLIPDGYEPVKEYLKENEDLIEIVENTSSFLTDFYSNFGLELLSTVDFISNKIKSNDLEDIKNKLKEWSPRKEVLFANDRFIELSLDHLKRQGLL